MFLKFSWGLLPNGRQSLEYMKLNELKNTVMGSVRRALFTCWFMTQSDLLVIHTLNLEWIRTQVTITHTAHQSSALCERFFSTFCAITRTWVQPNHFTFSYSLIPFLIHFSSRSWKEFVHLWTKCLCSFFVGLLLMNAQCQRCSLGPSVWSCALYNSVTPVSYLLGTQIRRTISTRETRVSKFGHQSHQPELGSSVNAT